jgi:hypothetical protein
MHVYDIDPGKRFALIDMTRIREGDRIANGIVLEQITPTGLIMSHDGELFRLMPRP